MEIKEAINHYKYGITHDLFKEPVTSYAKMSIEALEKNIPKRVLNIHKSENSEDIGYMGENTLYGDCPTCDEYVNNVWNNKYCGDCSQALEWKPKEKIKHTFEFETEEDWKPMAPTCWTECPFSFLIGLGDSCKCLNERYDIECPFVDSIDIKSNTIKHGRWELLDDCSNAGVYCSVCHKKVYKEHYANVKVKSKFCPNCGAIMDGEFKKL